MSIIGDAMAQNSEGTCQSRDRGGLIAFNLTLAFESRT